MHLYDTAAAQRARAALHRESGARLLPPHTCSLTLAPHLSPFPPSITTKIGLFKRSERDADEIFTRNAHSSASPEKIADVTHAEDASAVDTPHTWKLNTAGDGDVAMALFSSPDEVHEPIDPVEEMKALRKVDFMILPASISMTTRSSSSLRCRLLCRSRPSGGTRSRVRWKAGWRDEIWMRRRSAT